MNTNNVRIREDNRGFTFVETLVAIAILLIAVVGPMTIAQLGIQQARFGSNQLVAVFLAQEAIEGVREMRDNVALNAYGAGGVGVDTNAWFSGCGQSECAYNNGELQTCSSNNACELSFNPTTGHYSHVEHGEGVIDSGYKRVVIVNPEVDGGRMITVRVTWREPAFGSAPRSIQLGTWIYDQYRRYER